MIALTHLPMATGIVFIIGLIAAAYSSADSALTSLTTSFCVDFLNFEKSEDSEAQKKRQRLIVHIFFSIIILFIVIAFKAMNNEAVINNLFKWAGYTYGPLLGLFGFGILTKNYRVRDKYVPFIAIASPLISYLINDNSALLFGGFEFGFLIVALNGFLTFMGLWAISVRVHAETD